jgi:hypothetical protein
MSLYCTLLFSAATYLNEFVPYKTTKYSTNSFQYVAAENNKVWYKLIQVCGSREQQSTAYLNEFVLYFVVLCCHIPE